MDWLTEPFQFEFQRQALLVGSLAAIATSVVGTWVVIRGMAFLSDALAHGLLPGIAIAFLWGADPTLGAAVAAVIMVVGISGVGRAGRLSEDTSIGLLFVGMLAAGVVIISRANSYAGDLTSFLFGNILGVTDRDVRIAAVAALVVIVVCIVLYRPFLALCFNAEKAALFGMRPGATNLVMLLLIAVAVVASYRSVGTLLVSGLLIAPPAAAAQLARRVPTIMALAATLGVLSVAAGLVASYHWDTAAGASAAGAAVLTFFVALAVRTARDLLSRRAVPAPA